MAPMVVMGASLLLAELRRLMVQEESAGQVLRALVNLVRILVMAEQVPAGVEIM